MGRGTQGAIVGVVLVVLAACSKERSVKCGTGTELKDGACVISASVAQATAAAPVLMPAAVVVPTAAEAPPPVPTECMDLKAKLTGCTKMPEENRADALEGWHTMMDHFTAQSVADQKHGLAEFANTCKETTTKMATICSDGPDPGVAAVNTLVKLPTIEWTVLAAFDKGRHLSSNNQFQKSLTVDEGKLVQVRFKIKNLTKEKKQPDAPTLRDAQGRTFEPIEMSSFYVPGDNKTLGGFEDVPPSIGKEFWEAYQVADDSTGLQLLAYDLDVTNDIRPISLGLK